MKKNEIEWVYITAHAHIDIFKQRQMARVLKTGDITKQLIN